MMFSFERVLVIAPHVDDAEFGVGGLLAAQDRLGIMDAQVAIMSLSPYTRGGVEISLQERMAEGHAAAELLDYREHFLYSFEENDGASAAYVPVVTAIEAEIHQYKPTVVIGPLPSFNQDHRLVSDAFMTATRPMGCMDVAVLAYEYPGNGWGYPAPEHGLYLALSPGDMDLKMKALQAHRSQFSGRFGHVTPDGALALARLRGSECGAAFAERLVPLRVVLG